MMRGEDDTLPPRNVLKPPSNEDILFHALKELGLMHAAMEKRIAELEHANHRLENANHEMQVQIERLRISLEGLIEP